MVRLPHARRMRHGEITTSQGMRHIGRMRHSEITTYSGNATYREDEI